MSLFVIAAKAAIQTTPISLDSGSPQLSLGRNDVWSVD
jgi:hypothetical protein